MSTDIRQDQQIEDNLIILGAIQQDAVLVNGFKVDDRIVSNGIIAQRKVSDPISGRVMYSCDPHRLVNSINQEIVYRHKFETVDGTTAKPFAAKSESGRLLDMPIETEVNNKTGLVSATFVKSDGFMIVERNPKNDEHTLKLVIKGARDVQSFPIKKDHVGNLSMKDEFVVTSTMTDAQLDAREQARARAKEFCESALLCDLRPALIDRYLAGALPPVPKPAVVGKPFVPPKQRTELGNRMILDLRPSL